MSSQRQAKRAKKTFETGRLDVCVGMKLANSDGGMRHAFRAAPRGENAYLRPETKTWQSNKAGGIRAEIAEVVMVKPSTRDFFGESYRDDEWVGETALVEYYKENRHRWFDYEFEVHALPEGKTLRDAYVAVENAIREHPMDCVDIDGDLFRNVLAPYRLSLERHPTKRGGFAFKKWDDDEKCFELVMSPYDAPDENVSRN